MMTYRCLYFIYLFSGVLFILAMRGLSSPQTAQRGNCFGIVGMSVAVLAALLSLPTRNDLGILVAIFLSAGVGIFLAQKVKMTALPQMIALLNGVGGLSSVLVGLAQLLKNMQYSHEITIGLVIGSIAFSGSVIAFFKLWEVFKFRFQRFGANNFILLFLFGVIVFLWGNFFLKPDISVAYYLVLSSVLFGLFLTLPIGGADMPIIVSVLNACSGWAAAGIGFSLQNVVLIITGALVGASGTILSLFMTRAMNKSLKDVLFLSPKSEQKSDFSNKIVHTAYPADAAFLMKNANKVIIVPGYGMAASGAQYAIKNMAQILQSKYHVEVKFAIHPVAGRMPGHMNVLLAEAKVDYENVFLLDEINPDFETADVAYVIGANDITNPLAKTDVASPLYGMPVLEVMKAKTVLFVKRSLNVGYSGVQNPLFFEDNTLMIYGDAKKVTEEIVSDL